MWSSERIQNGCEECPLDIEKCCDKKKLNSMYNEVFAELDEINNE